MTTEIDWYRDPSLLLAELRRGQVAPAQLPVMAGYEDLRELRRGGQGVVYTAYQRSTKRQVAIKVLYEDFIPSPTKRRRFEREIELVAALEHPHIVRVYDSGVTAEGRLYLVMEYIDGSPLDEWLRTRYRSRGTGPEAPTVRELLGLFAIICEAVGYAHLRGVMHRDLKPSNILMDAHGQPHVVDFGIAKLTGGAGGVAPAVTLEGHFLGTLSYASPEQVRGDPAAIDVRTDVYSLGVLLYEVVTGGAPYATSGPIADAVHSIAEQAPLALGIARRAAQEASGSLTAPVGRVDHELDTMVLKALAKDPQRRYSSAEALGRDLRRYLAGEPIDAQRDSGWYVLRKMVRRHRGAATAGAAFVVLLMMFGAAMALMYRRSRLEAAKANQIRVFLEDTLGSVGKPTSGGDVTLREVLDEAVHWVQIALADQPEVEASLRTTIGNSYRALGLHDNAERQLTRALEIHRNLFGDRHGAVAQSLNGLAQIHRDRGDLVRAEELSREALAIRRQVLGPNHPDLPIGLQNLASIARTRGDEIEAEKLLREALEIRRKLYGDRHADTAMTQFMLADILRAQRRFAEAEQLHRQALDTRLQVLDEEHPDVARSQLALGGVWIEAGKYGEAEPMLLRAHDKLEQTRGGGHSDTAEAVRLLIRLYQATGDDGRADLFRQRLPEP